MVTIYFDKHVFSHLFKAKEEKYQNPLAIPSKRRNPLLADFFSRLGLMERRGSGMRKIYALISADAHVTTARMAEEIGVSDRQIRKYLKRLTELKLIAREGSRKTGTWKITDEEYTGFFDRI